MIEVVQDLDRFPLANDPWVRAVEGWILGCPDQISTSPKIARPEVPKQPRVDRERHAMSYRPGPSGGAATLCPACHEHMFARWPWGWDAHAAHKCSGVEGETPELRKQNFRERFLS